MAHITPKKIKVSDLIPYTDNHRVITKQAVNAVAASIKRYGYNVPILVDTENVIIAGHVRHQALLQLKVKEVLVMEVQEQDEVAKDKMRLLDNAISQAAEWHDVKLGQELRMIKELGDSTTWDTFASMFDEGSALDNLLNQSLGGKIKDITEYDLDKAGKSEHNKFNKVRTNDKDREVTCPKCGSKFEIRVYGE